MDLLFSPHSDDEVLWTAYTIQQHHPLVVIVFDGVVQGQRGEPVTAMERRNESIAALAELLSTPPLFLGYSDADKDWPSMEANFRNLIERHKPKNVWAPAVEDGGHAQHNHVGRLVRQLFPTAHRYLTYTKAGKSEGRPVKPEPHMIQRKLRALSCYESQIGVANCREHFLRDLKEYMA